MSFEPWQWVLATIAALIVGISKTGVGGLGMLAVVIFAQLVPAKQASGMVLPMLCFADIIAVFIYRQHAQWSHLRRLFPWTAAGVLLGYLAMGRIDDTQARVLIGGIVVALVTLTLIRRRKSGHETEHGAWFAPTIGVLGGFTTLVANAAGPLMAVYFLAMRLPKLHFVGTGAVFFLILNLFKVPFMVHLDLISAQSFAINILLLPAVLAGAWIGRQVITRINQRVFENLALALGGLAGLKLVMG